MRDPASALVIGCGAAGAIHASELAGRGMTMHCHDADMTRAEALAAAIGGYATRDSAAVDVDLVVIATPANTHLAIANAELLRPDGRAVVIEKPVGLDPGATMAWAQSVMEAGQPVYVAESSAYGTDVEGLRRMLRSGELGSPVQWRAAYATSYRPQAWSYDLAVGGGAFLEGGVHMLTVARLLFGEAVRWGGAVRCLAGGSAPDTGTILVEYVGGDMLSLSIAWGTEAAFTGGDVPQGGSWLIGSTKAMPLAVGNDHGAMWDELLDCIKTMRKPLCGVKIAAAAVADCWRCYEAAGLEASGDA